MIITLVLNIYIELYKLMNKIRKTWIWLTGGLVVALMTIYIYLNKFSLKDNKPKWSTDINLDGKTDNRDQDLVSAAFGNPCMDCREDINMDGSVDISDLLLLIGEMEQSTDTLIIK